MAQNLAQETSEQDTQSDLVDDLISDWRRERPDLDPSPMNVVLRLLRVGRQLDARISDVLKPHGLLYSEFDVLATLLRSGAPYELMPTELQQAVVLTSGAMTALLDRLTSKGLIQRNESKSDGRSKTASLTPKGVELANALIAVRVAEAKDACEHLRDSDQQTLADILKVFEAQLDAK